MNGEMNSQTTIKKTEVGNDEELTVTGSSEDLIVNKVDNMIAEGYLVTKSEVFITKHKSYRAFVLIEVKKSALGV